MRIRGCPGICVGVCLIFCSCGGFSRVPGGAFAREVLGISRGVSLKNPLPVTEKQKAPATVPRAILLRQEDRASGLPGFADNAFTSLHGVYTLEGPGTAEDAPTFDVWASPRAMYYQEGLWTPGSTAFERREREYQGGRISAFTVNTPYHGPWTVLFAFSADPDPERQNRIMDAWIERFTYFLSLKNLAGDVSLPAALDT